MPKLGSVEISSPPGGAEVSSPALHHVELGGTPQRWTKVAPATPHWAGICNKFHSVGGTLFRCLGLVDEKWERNYQNEQLLVMLFGEGALVASFNFTSIYSTIQSLPFEQCGGLDCYISNIGLKV